MKAPLPPSSSSSGSSSSGQPPSSSPPPSSSSRGGSRSGPGTRPATGVVTIADVAARAGVSNGTVSRCIHEPERVSPETRARIEAAVAELGYAPNTLARNFRMGSTGVILVLTSGIGDPFYGEVIAGIGRVARLKGYTVRIEELEGAPLSSRDLNAFLQQRQADGIIVLGSPWPFESAGSGPGMAAGPARAIVVCGETSDPELMRYPRFQIDGHAAALELTLYLAALGHREIGFIGSALSTVPLREREAGYRAGMARAGLALSPGWIVDGGVDMEGARRAVDEILAAGARPSALVCVTDELALAAMAQLQARGIPVPEAMAVAGFDDTRYAAIANPPLTTVAQPAQEIGARATHHLLATLAGSVPKGAGAAGGASAEAPEGPVEYLAHKLVIRRSTRSLI